MRDRDFENDLKINKYKLHEECMAQASLYHYYSELLADVKSEKDKQENKLKFMVAETEIELRKNPPEGIKITEATIKALLIIDLKIKQQQGVLNKTKSELYHLEFVINSIEHKKTALKLLVQLFSVNYFSIPDGKKETQEDIPRREMRDNLNKRNKE